MFLQQVGRGLRPVYALSWPLDTVEQRLAAIAASAKPVAIVLDHVGNTLRHGFPDDDRQWTLEGEKKTRAGLEEDEGRRRLKVRQCPVCYRVHKAADNCPSCGHVYEKTARQIEEEAGELKRLDAEAMAAIRSNRESMLAQCVTLQDYQNVARQLGYKAGWAWYEWNKGQGRRGA